MVHHMSLSKTLLDTEFYWIPVKNSRCLSKHLMSNVWAKLVCRKVSLFEIYFHFPFSSKNPFSVAVLNQIGNYWRIKGNTLYAIECFRRALSLNPDHPDILLNLARVLYNQHFINDTIFLTKKSLHVKDPNDNTWLQHYTLGEAYMSLNRYDEAASYFKKALEHNPSMCLFIYLHNIYYSHYRSI